MGGFPAPGVATSALTFVTVLLTLKPVCLVDHEHARQAEIGIFELLQVPGMVLCLTLSTFPRIAFTWKVVFSCSTVAYLASNAVIRHISKGHGDGVTGLLCTVVPGLTFLPLGLATDVSSVPQCVLIVFHLIFCWWYHGACGDVDGCASISMVAWFCVANVSPSLCSSWNVPFSR